MIPRARVAYRQAHWRQHHRYRDVSAGAGLQGQIGGRVTRWHSSWYPWPAKKWSAVAQYTLLRNNVTIFPAWVDFGEIERIHNEADFSAPADSHFEAILRTADALVPARARLFNVTDNVVVSGSQVATTSTTPVRLRSPPMSLPSGSRLYKAQFGA